MTDRLAQHARAPVLSPRDRRLLRAAAALVPRAEREDWVLGWEAELWHARFGQHARVRSAFFFDLGLGIVLDALWVRRESCRRQVHGTAVLCLASLAGLSGLAALLAAELAGGDQHAWSVVRALLLHTAVATPLVLFVGWATGWQHSEAATLRNPLPLLRRGMFLAAKTGLVLGLNALLSVDLCLPFHQSATGLSEVLQQLFFVLFSLVALRWSFTDQERRCKHCLRLLASPAQIGRRSHNFLDWAGTEEICLDGHGALTSPEMISSWCERGRWTPVC